MKWENTNELPWPASVSSMITSKNEYSNVQSPSPADNDVAHPAKVEERVAIIG